MFRKRISISGLLLCVSLFVLGCTGPGATRHDPERSAFESEPVGASIYLDGGFVGTTPTKFFLPDRPQVEIRLMRPGYLPVEEVLYRDSGHEGAGEGVGWESLYFFPMNPKRN